MRMKPMASSIIGPEVPRRGNALSRRFWLAVLRMAGWRLGGEFVNLSHFVIIAAPHTSNWDFVIAMAVKWGYGLDFRWIGKHTLFRGPFGPAMRLMGGIPINRERDQGLVARAVELFDSEPRLMLAITPEGTRSRVQRWKTGFYHIATGAGVPIVRAYIDYPSRMIRFARPFVPTGDMDADMRLLKDSYEPYRRAGKRPERG